MTFVRTGRKKNIFKSCFKKTKTKQNQTISQKTPTTQQNKPKHITLNILSQLLILSSRTWKYNYESQNLCYTGGGPLCWSPVYGHNSCCSEVQESPVPTGAASAGLWRDSPVMKLVRAASSTRMETETQRVLLALEKEVLKWDTHDDIKLHLHRTVSHKSGSVFRQNLEAIFPPHSLTPKPPKANQTPQTNIQILHYQKWQGCYCMGAAYNGSLCSGFKMQTSVSKFLLSYLGDWRNL